MNRGLVPTFADSNVTTTSMKPPFQFFGIPHLAALAACFLSLIFLLLYLKKRHNPRNRTRDIRVFTIIFLLIEVALIGSKIASDEWTPQYNLPLHLCDISAITILIALHFRSKTAFELGWFWGFTGGLMAILTPNLQFIDWYFIPFFIWHLFLIAGPVYQFLADNYEVPYRSIYTTLAATILLSGIMFLINSWLGSNYMFVNEKISSFDALGLPDFPAYLPYLVVIGLIMFHLVWGIAKVLNSRPHP